MPVIVVVDHRDSDRSTLANLARSADGDATVRAFADPCEALDWVNGNTPDLVIAGFETPGMESAGFTRRFRFPSIWSSFTAARSTSRAPSARPRP